MKLLITFNWCVNQSSINFCPSKSQEEFARVLGWRNTHRVIAFSLLGQICRIQDWGQVLHCIILFTLYPSYMTYVLFFGSLFVSFSPALALFLLVISRSNQLIILTIGGYISQTLHNISRKYL